jgi:nitrile hydratase
MSREHHPEPEPYAAIRAKAIESLLVEKGLIASDAVDARVQAYEQDIGPLNGARVVAHAWVDPVYRERLLENGTEAIAEFGYTGAQGAEIVVLENKPDLQNVVVCTLCSCYPWPVLGLPPTWYKSNAYRSKGVWPGAGRVSRSAGLGQQFGHTLHGLAGASRRHRGHD